MKKLTKLSVACTTILLLSACDSGSSSTNAAAAAQGNAACQANAACAKALAAATQVPLNQPASSLTNQVPAAQGSTTVAFGDGSGGSITNVNVPVATSGSGTTGTSQVANASANSLDAAKILDEKSGINYENAVSAFNKAVATGNKSVSDAATEYSGAAGAK